MVVVPAFRGESSPYMRHYASVGGSPRGVVTTLFTDPAAPASALASSEDFAYLLQLIGPLGGALLFAPGLAVAALPQLLAILLSDSSSFMNPRYHYTSPVIPFLVAATVLAVARMPRRLHTAVAAAILCFSLGMCLAYGPLKSRESYVTDLYTESQFTRRVNALRAALALVHLSARRHYYGVPKIGHAEWLIIEERDAALATTHTGYWSPRELHGFITATLRNKGWQLVLDSNGVLVLKKKVRNPDATT
jgi:hypothetical protein